MGTSKSLSTPSGGAWTGAKRTLTQLCANPGGGTAPSAVSAVISAAGGITLPRVATGGGGTAPGSRKSRIAVSQAVAGLGAFAERAQSEGFEAGLAQLGLDDLAGKPAPEVVARIAEHLARHSDGHDAELVKTALQEALLAAADLAEETGYSDLQEGLESFLEERGALGLVELFLENYVFDVVWSLIEDHVRTHTDGNDGYESVLRAIQEVCRDEVRAKIAELGSDPDIDWFGRPGIRLASEIVTDLASRLRQL